MLEEYIYHGKEKLRCGYTTGSCAAGAAKAAVRMLLSGAAVTREELVTPKGVRLTLEIEDARLEADRASCAVRKDSGDDPDVTNGILVYAEATRIPQGIEIDGGEGVGRVTRPGLDQPVGNAAINSTPRAQIEAAVREMQELYEDQGGIRIVISVPGGREIAAHTFNPRMGIEGGISIIGTSGIVEPMSNQALIDTIAVEERMRRAEGRGSLLVTVGNYSEQFLEKELPQILPGSVKCSNFIGDAIDTALSLGFEEFLLVGHIGKLVKLGAGIMNTHSAQADGRMEVLVTCGVLAGVPGEILRQIPACVTVDAALDILEKQGCRERVMEILMERVGYHLDARVKGEMRIGAILFSNRYGILGKTRDADEIRKHLLERK